MNDSSNAKRRSEQPNENRKDNKSKARKEKQQLRTTVRGSEDKNGRNDQRNYHRV